MKKKGVLMVISGFSGAGKGTLMKKLVADYDNYALSISMTTRQPREGEVNGREYFFVTKEEFESRIEAGGMIEYASYCDNFYGTPKAYVEEQLANGKDVILEIEIQGAHKVKEIYPEALLMFVMPPSAEELYRRLKGRGTESDEVIAKRMARAVEESEGINTYDYIVINDKLEDCIAQINTIVNAAHQAPENNEEFIVTIKNELKDLLKGE